MTGSWGVYRDGRRWGRSPRRAWLVLRAARPRGRAVRRPGARAHDRRHARASTSGIAGLGPDILAPELDEDRFLRAPARRRPDAADRRRAARPAHDRGHRQPVEVRGLLRRRVDPWRPTGEVSDDEVLRVVRLTRPRMQQSARDGFQARGPGDLRPRRPALPALRRRRSARAARATTTARHTGAPDASTEAHRPQGRRPHRAGQHARLLRRGARRRRRHGRVRRAAREPRRHRAPVSPTTSRPPRGASRSRSRRASPTSPRTPGRASSSTSTSRPPATSAASSTRCASTASPSAR